MLVVETTMVFPLASIVFTDNHTTVQSLNENKHPVDQLASSELWRTKQIPKNALKMSGNLGKLTL